MQSGGLILELIGSPGMRRTEVVLEEGKDFKVLPYKEQELT